MESPCGTLVLMSATIDYDAIRIEFDADGHALPISKEKVCAILSVHARQCAPSRFAVLEIRPEEDSPGYDGELIAWGLASSEYIDVHSVEPGMRGRFSSMASMSLLFGEAYEIVWIDPEPAS
jgi:hypothetical protein